MGLLENAGKKNIVKNARNMIILSYPKVGKTSLMTKLPGNYLILDFDKGGCDYYEGNSIRIDDLNTLGQLKQEFMEKQPKFDFIVFDTITELYSNIINSIAVANYNKEEKKNKPLDWDITLLAYGIGYAYKRNALQQVVSFFQQYCKCLILIGHVADKALSGNGETTSVQDLDIEGKLKNILALKTDAIGILNRTLPNQNTLSFKTNVSQIAGTRIRHLANQDIVISELNENGELIAYWDKVFIK